MMEKFEFLLGDWNLEYNIPKSSYSEAATGTGTGTFKRALDDKYVFFDYSSVVPDTSGEAHVIITWDEKSEIYGFWWFESSGNFSKATCNFIDENTLYLNWHDSLLKQTFKKINTDKVILRMENPVSNDKYELLLEVIFTRK